MNASTLRISKRKAVGNNRGLNVQIFGENNDYPQRVRSIVASSGTGSACLRTFRKFLKGNGLNNKLRVINSKGHTTQYILEQVCDDFAMHNGFAIHINYNDLYHATELYHVPFEHVRFEALDQNGQFSRVGINDDWGREFGALKPFLASNTVFIDLYNPDPQVIAGQVETAGGWDKYNGQVLYVSGAGDKVYPLAAYDAELTNMNTEEGVGNVLNRNTRNGFRPAAMVIDRKNTAESEDQHSELLDSLISLQTDENTSKLVYVSVDSEEEVPSVVPFETTSYDKELTFTSNYIKDAIGRIFNQPPILRAEDVGSNFGADALRNAYNFYNSVTASDRAFVMQYFNQALSLFPQGTASEDIEPLVYGYGSTNIKDIPSELLSVMTVNEKRELLGLPPLAN